MYVHIFFSRGDKNRYSTKVFDPVEKKSRFEIIDLHVIFKEAHSYWNKKGYEIIIVVYSF